MNYSYLSSFTIFSVENPERRINIKQEPMDKNDAFRILFKKMINLEARNLKLEDEVAALRNTMNLDEKSRDHSHYLKEVVQKLMNDYPQLINVEELNNIFGLHND